MPSVVLDPSSRQHLVERLFAFVVAAAEPGAALAPIESISSTKMMLAPACAPSGTGRAPAGAHAHEHLP